MELDEFKTLLQLQPADKPASPSVVEIEKAIRAKTGTVTMKLKQNILLELALCCLLAAACVWMGIHWHYFYVRCIAVFAVGYCLLFLYFLWALYKKILFYERSAPSVRQGLEQFIGILERFARLYFQFNMFMLPVAFVAGLLSGYLDISTHSGNIGFNWMKAGLFYTAFFIAWSVFMYVFSRWYIKKQYGNYLQQLKEQLKDIKNG